mgnify:CR=1 FL=1
MLFEEFLGEVFEVDAPVAPDVAAGGLEVGVFEAFAVEVFAELGVAVVEEVGLADGDVVEFRVVGEEGVELLVGVLVHLRGDVAAFGAVDVEAGAEESDVVEGLGVVQRELEGVAAAHREAGNGPACGGLYRTVVLVDEGDDVLEVGFEGGVEGAAVVWLEHTFGGLAGGGLVLAVAVGHNDDHRLGLALGDEVVEDLRGAAGAEPGLLIAAHTVEEVEDGVSGLAALVAGRGVNGHTAVHPEHVGVVPDPGDGAVRDVLDDVVVGAAAGDDEVVHQVGDVALDVGVGRVVEGEAVDVEAEVVELALEGLGGVFPDAAGGLFQLGYAWLLDFAVVGDFEDCRLEEVTGDLDFDGLRGFDLEGDGLVRVDRDGLEVLEVPQRLLGACAGRRCEGERDECYQFFHFIRFWT